MPLWINWFFFISYEVFVNTPLPEFIVSDVFPFIVFFICFFFLFDFVFLGGKGGFYWPIFHTRVLNHAFRDQLIFFLSVMKFLWTPPYLNSLFLMYFLLLSFFLCLFWVFWRGVLTPFFHMGILNYAFMDQLFFLDQIWRNFLTTPLLLW